MLSARVIAVIRFLSGALVVSAIVGLGSFVAGCNRGSSATATSAPSASGAVRFDQTQSMAQGDPAARRSIEPASSGSAPADITGPKEVAVLAGGCFWGMEDLLRKIPGVLETDVGYAGGATPNPKYEQVRSGKTGHAEAVRVVFDPTRLSYERLLEHWFFRMHDPTTENRQGNDVGTQYRSAIFFTSKAQEATARQVKARVDASGKWQDPIVTQIVEAGPFTLAEGYHQDYLQVNPDGYTCHYLRD